MRLRENRWKKLIILAITLIIAGTGTVAYFVTSETAHNVISTSGVDIELYELSDSEGDESSLVPFTDLDNVVPGITYSKIPYVENVDTEPVWVRIILTLNKTDGEGEVATIPRVEDLIELGGLSERWERAEDGFYYYNAELFTSETTEPIFKTVKFKEEMSNEYQDMMFSLIVSADATQVKNNGTSAKTANWTERGGA